MRSIPPRPTLALVPTLLLLFLAIGSVGCAGRLMPTPVVVADGLVDPFESVAPSRRTVEAPIFVASGRAPSGDPSPALFYSSQRSREVRIGVATLELGSTLSWDDLVEESRRERRRVNPKIRLVAFEEFGTLWSTAWPPDARFAPNWQAPGVDRAPANRFVEMIEQMLDESRERQITVFVHGFNTRFAGNLEVAAEFWHYMVRDDVFISFNWPSRGSMFSYQIDKANAEFAVRQFRRLLEFLAQETSVSRINIIAHSAGNPVVAEALRQLSLMHHDLSNDEARRVTKLGRVVLAAPDMDLDAALSANVDGAGRLTDGVAVYASTKDRALAFSGNIFGNIRLGRSIGRLTPKERDALIANSLQWIDATEAQRHDSSFLGHSYFHANPWISSDIMLFLRLGATPEERGLVRDPETGFLVFPRDYRERLPEIVAGLRAKYLTQSE
jgi:esterase/lipase superfamily enzyme